MMWKRGKMHLLQGPSDPRAALSPNKAVSRKKNIDRSLLTGLSGGPKLWKVGIKHNTWVCSAQVAK